MAIIGWRLPQIINIPNYGRLPFKLDVAITSTVFVAIGYYFKKYKFFDIIVNKNYSLFLVVLLLVTNIIFGPILNGYVNICNFDYSNICYYYIASISGSLFIIVLSGFLENIQLLAFYGSNSLSMFAFHSYFLCLTEVILSFIFKYKIMIMVNIPIHVALICALIIYMSLYFFTFGYNYLKRLLFSISKQIVSA